MGFNRIDIIGSNGNNGYPPLPDCFGEYDDTLEPQRGCLACPMLTPCVDSTSHYTPEADEGEDDIPEILKPQAPQ